MASVTCPSDLAHIAPREPAIVARRILRRGGKLHQFTFRATDRRNQKHAIPEFIQDPDEGDKSAVWRPRRAEFGRRTRCETDRLSGPNYAYEDTRFTFVLIPL